jgi:hypothetical protein
LTCFLTGLRFAALSTLAPTFGQDLLLTAAIVFNQLGETDKALNYLEEAAQAGASPFTLRDTPNFDNLHTLPRFQHLAGPG